MAAEPADAVERPAPDWVLVASARVARVFERDEESGALCTVADPVLEPQGQRAAALGGACPGSERETLGDAGAAEPDSHDARIARELANMLEDAATAKRMPALRLLAPEPFLGELMAQLGKSTRQRLKSAVAVDLTPLHGADLARGIALAIGPATR